MKTDKELLDDIRNAFRKAGWKEDILGGCYLLGTVEETLYRYNRMETTLNGFVDLVKCIQTNTMKVNNK
jgi:hypothetical protein